MLVHNHVRNAKLRCFFFLNKLHTLNVFDVTNNIWPGLIKDNRLRIIDNGLLIRILLISNWCLRLRLLLLLLLLHLHELLEGAFDLNLAALPLLRHGFGALLQQVDCLPLLFFTEYKIVLAYLDKQKYLQEMNGTALRAFHHLSETSIVSLA